MSLTRLSSRVLNLGDFLRCPYRWRGSLVTAGPDQRSGLATGSLGSQCSQPPGPAGSLADNERRVGRVPRNPEDTEEGSVHRQTGTPWGPSGAPRGKFSHFYGSWRESTQ